jgi:PPOX class probable F420-dependent enzyme
MNTKEAHQFIARNHRAVLATIKRDGRPQLSNIAYALDHDGRIRISVTRDRAKTRNLRRDPRATLAIQSGNWYAYLWSRPPPRWKMVRTRLQTYAACTR